MKLTDSSLIPDDNTILEWEHQLQQLVGNKPPEWLSPLERLAMTLMATVLVQSVAISELEEEANL